MSSTNLSINGHHLEVTPAIREYVMKKIERVLKHTDNATAAIINLSVEPLHLSIVQTSLFASRARSFFVKPLKMTYTLR